MTIGALPISLSEVADELGVALPLSLADIDARWLADNPSGAISLSEFAGKQSVKFVDSAYQAGAGLTYTFTGVNFGTDMGGRVIVVVAIIDSDQNAILDQTGCTIDGGAASGSDTGWTAAGSSGGAGVWARAGVTGTSGTVTVTYTDGGFGAPFQAKECRIYVFSISGLASAGASGSDGAFSSTNVASISGSLVMPTNGVIIMGAVTSAGASGVTFGGATEFVDADGGNHRICVGFSNRLGADSTYAVSISSASSKMALHARSYTQ